MKSFYQRFAIIIDLMTTVRADFKGLLSFSATTRNCPSSLLRRCESANAKMCADCDEMKYISQSKAVELLSEISLFLLLWPEHVVCCLYCHLQAVRILNFFLLFSSFRREPHRLWLRPVDWVNFTLRALACFPLHLCERDRQSDDIAAELFRDARYDYFTFSIFFILSTAAVADFVKRSRQKKVLETFCIEYPHSIRDVVEVFLHI